MPLWERWFPIPNVTLGSSCQRLPDFAGSPAHLRRDGGRLARIRKERGFTQNALAEKTGFIQTLVSDYERGKLRRNADMLLRFAMALEVSTDDLLQPGGPTASRKPSRKVLRRLGAHRGVAGAPTDDAATHYRHFSGKRRVEVGAALRRVKGA